MQKEPTVEFLLSQGFSKTFAKRFWNKVSIGKNCFDCWGWSGCKVFGYGVISNGVSTGKNTLAHRASWILHNGPIPDGMFVLHKCDNPPCSNPNHLFIGNHQDNASDKVLKGRQLVGNQCHLSKFTASDVLSIRSNKLKETQSSIAKRFGVNQSCISEIISRKTWKHIP